MSRPDLTAIDEINLSAAAPEWDLAKHGIESINALDLDTRRATSIGEGSSGTVRSVVHIPTGKTFVIKPISKSAALERELEVFSNCASPFIVTFHGVVHAPGMHHILLVMEKMDGSIHDLLAASMPRIPLLVVTAIVRQVLEGLLFLHSERHLVHRDLKPANLLFNKLSGEVKITDFGVSSRQSAHDSSMHTFIGSMGYMSPERLDAKGGHSFPADIWSLALTVIEALTGIHPYRKYAKDDALVMQTPVGYWNVCAAVAEDPPIPVVSDNLTEECADFLRQCMHVDKTARWTAQQLLSHSFVSGLTLERAREIIAQHCSVVLAHGVHVTPPHEASLQKKLQKLSLGK